MLKMMKRRISSKTGKPTGRWLPATSICGACNIFTGKAIRRPLTYRGTCVVCGRKLWYGIVELHDLAPEEPRV